MFELLVHITTSINYHHLQWSIYKNTDHFSFIFKNCYHLDPSWSQPYFSSLHFLTFKVKRSNDFAAFTCLSLKDFMLTCDALLEANDRSTLTGLGFLLRHFFISNIKQYPTLLRLLRTRRNFCSWCWFIQLQSNASQQTRWWNFLNSRTRKPHRLYLNRIDAFSILPFYLCDKLKDGVGF